MPVDFGPRTAAAFWILSLICQVLLWLGIINVGFIWVWSFATVVDKSLKLLDSEDEEAFLEWAGNVWDSCFNKHPRNGGDGPDQDDGDYELPIFHRN